MQIHDPAMDFLSSDTSAEWDAGFAKNQDPYGEAIYRFASSWATLMDQAIANGESVVDCAERCSREADSEGITGFMYGAAVSMLSAWWKHGETLRRWHNKETQIGTEGDEANEKGTVLNPAILTISSED